MRLSLHSALLNHVSKDVSTVLSSDNHDPYEINKQKRGITFFARPSPFSQLNLENSLFPSSEQASFPVVKLQREKL